MARKKREKLDILQVGGKYKYSDLCRIFNEEQKAAPKSKLSSTAGDVNTCLTNFF